MANFLKDIGPLLKQRGLQVLDEQQMFITCPGADKHTAANAARDCKLYENPHGPPRAFCQHQSCAAEIAMLNAAFATGEHGRNPTPLKAGRVPAQAEPLAAAARAALPEILTNYAWSKAEMAAKSPSDVGCYPIENHWHLILCLFPDHDILWIGRDIFDTGRPKHRWRFRPVGEWLALPSCPGPFTCPSSFKHGVCSRSHGNVLAPKYLVVESDTLGRDEIGAVFRYLIGQFELRLRAVVDTAGRSLHGWFEYPPPAVMKKLEVILPALGCDPALLKPSQPCRLPGAIRDGKHQRLIYFAE